MEGWWTLRTFHLFATRRMGQKKFLAFLYSGPLGFWKSSSSFPGLYFHSHLQFFPWLSSHSLGQQGSSPGWGLRHCLGQVSASRAPEALKAWSPTEVAGPPGKYEGTGQWAGVLDPRKDSQGAVGRWRETGDSAVFQQTAMHFEALAGFVSEQPKNTLLALAQR